MQIRAGHLYLLLAVQQTIAVEIALTINHRIGEGRAQPRMEASLILTQHRQPIRVVVGSRVHSNRTRNGQFPEVRQGILIAVHIGGRGDWAVERGDHSRAIRQLPRMHPALEPVLHRCGEVLDRSTEVVEAIVGHRSAASILKRAVGIRADIGAREGPIPNAHFVNLSHEAFTHSRDSASGNTPRAGFCGDTALGHGHTVHMQAQITGGRIIDASQMIPVVVARQRRRGRHQLLGRPTVIDTNITHIRLPGIQAQLIVDAAATGALHNHSGAAEGRVQTHPCLNRPCSRQTQTRLIRHLNVLGRCGQRQHTGSRW